MAKINIQNGIISSSADYSLYRGLSKIATIQDGEFRVLGDLIAENYIVSSSVTNIEYQSLSGSTIFGDSGDDTHTFLGNTISGSATSTGSFGSLVVADAIQNGLAVNGNLTVAPDGDSVLIVKNTGTNNVGVFAASGDVLQLGANNTSYGISINTSNQATFAYDATFNGNISGSSSSTGSFGSIHTAGNVGIGTATPSAVLHVRGDAGASDPLSTLFIESTTNHGGIVIDAENTKQAHVRFMSNGALKWQMRSPFHSGTNPDSLRFYSWTHAGDVMTLKNDGNVGIGTSSPDRTLHVNGVGHFGSTDTGVTLADNGGIASVYGLNSAGSHYRPLELRTAASGAGFYQDTTGNVGIGTASPSQKLTVAGTVSASSGDGGLELKPSSRDAILTYTDRGTQRWNIWNDQDLSGVNNVLRFDTSLGSSNMVIKQSGEVGIGTTSPAYSLDISGNAILLGSDNAAITRTNSTLKQGGLISPHYTNAEEPHLLARVVANTGASRIEIGGGTSAYNSVKSIVFYTAANDTTLTGTAALTLDSSQDATFAGDVISTKANGVISGSATSTGSFGSIHTAGNVGIGTNAPTRVLQVNGAAHATSHLVGSLTTALGIAGSFPDANDSELGPGYLVVARDDTAAAKQLQFWKNGSLHSGISTDTNGFNIVGSDGNADVTVDTSGNVGIGETSPTVPLHIKAADTDTVNSTSAGHIMLTDDSGIDYWKMRLSATNSGNLHYDYNSGGTFYTAMSLDRVGKVGIGTDSPATLLHLEAETPVLTVKSTYGVDDSQNTLGFYQGGGYLVLENTDGDDKVIIRAYSDSYFNGGNVGIGTTSPSVPLEVNGLTRITRLGAATTYQQIEITDVKTTFNGQDPDGYMHYAFKSNDSTKLFINGSSGNVGIGTTSPGSTLTIKDTGDISTDTFISGITGDGFRITDGGADGVSMEIDNIMVRNTLRTHIFQKDVVKATNGILYVADSGVISGSNGTNTVTFLNSKSADFPDNTRLWYKDAREDDGTIISVQFDINDATPTNDGTYTTYDVDGIVGDLADMTGSVGGTAVRISGGGLVLDASSTEAPYMDVLRDSGSTVVRTGKLTGITSPRFGTLSGFGLWASGSVYLEGAINATTGNIGGWGIGATAISSSGNNMIIDAATKRITINDGSADRIYLGEVDGTTTYGMKIFDGNGTDDGDLLVELGEGQNMIAGWGLTPTMISSSGGNVQVDAGNSRFLIQDPAGKQRVRMGLLNASSQYGISGSDADGNLLFKLGEAGNEIAGWEISGSRIHKYSSVADGGLVMNADGLSYEVYTGSNADTNTIVQMGKFNADAATTLLVHSDTVNASTTFVDSSPSARTITHGASSDITHATAKSKFGKSAIYRPTSGDNKNIILGDHANLTRTTDDFTVDCWVYMLALTEHSIFLAKGSSWWLNYDMAGYGTDDKFNMMFYNGSAWQNATNTMTPVINTWYHLAAVVSSNELTLYVDGVGGTPITLTGTTEDGGTMVIGGWATTYTGFTGYMDEIRISKGIARWTSNFTPPSTPYIGGNFGIRGNDTSNNELFKLGSAGNVIAGWNIEPGTIQYDNTGGSLSLSATKQSLNIFTSSIDYTQPKLVLGKLPLHDGTVNEPYGLAVFSGDGVVSGSEASASVLITANKARLAGWELSPGKLSSGTVASIDGNQASIALGTGATSAGAEPADNLFFVSASTNPVFYVGKNFSYTDNILTAAGWKISSGQISSSNGQAILSGSGVLSLGSGTHDYAQANRTYIDGPGNRMSIGTGFKYASDALTIDGSATIGGFSIDATTISSSNNSLILKDSGQITGSAILFKGGTIGGMTVAETEVTVGEVLKFKSSGQITGSAVLFKGGTIGGFTLSSTTLESDSSNTKRGIKLEPGNSIRGYGNTAHSTTCIAGKYSFGVAPVSPPAGGDGGWNSDFPPDGGGGGTTL